MVPPPSSDLAIAAGAMAGDPEATARFLELAATVPGVIRSRHRRMGGRLDGSELDDVAQEALVAAWRKLGTYRGESTLQTWLHRFAVIELLKAFQRRGRSRLRAAAIEAVDHERSDEQAARLAEAHLLHDSLATLDPDLAAVLRAKHFDGWTFEEVAQRHRIPLGTVKTRYYKALELLRVRIAPRWNGRLGP